MKGVLTDIFVRTLAPLLDGTHECLRVEEFSAVEDSQTCQTPVGTAFIVGFDGQKKEPLAILAITSPGLSTDASTLLALVTRRAHAYKAPYFITWTLRDAVLWKTPELGTPAEKSHLEKVRDYEDNYEIAQGAERQVFSEPLRLRCISIGRKIIWDIEKLFKDQALELISVEATYFVERLVGSVHELLPLVTDSLHIRFETDLDLRKSFQRWAASQGIAGDYKDRDYALAIARQVIYRLLGKVLFYQSLRRAARQLPSLSFDGIDLAQILPTLRRAFGEALKVDYHAVFAEDLPDIITWPAQAVKLLCALIHDFNTRDFSNLPQDVVGSVFERLIPPEDRHLLGQYFTSERLCDLGIAFCVNSAEAMTADVTCGTGTFLIRAYDRKRWLGNHDHAILLSQLWGIDIAPFPSELAVINLFRQNLTAVGNFPRIACRDFFTIKPTDTLPFPPLKMDIKRPEYINEPIPAFDAIVGNFPYVGGNQIEQKERDYLEFLRKIMIEDWLEIYPELFFYPNKKEQESFEKSIAAGLHKSCNRERLHHKISSYADLYVYLFFHASRFLKPGGRMGIITSNAWLDVNYGYVLQKFFCDHFKIVAILESRCEPWFTEASVNTVYTILERCENLIERDNNLVKFVKVKKQLSDLVPCDPQIRPIAWWNRWRSLMERIEFAGLKNEKPISKAVASEEDEDLRIRIRQQGDLRDELLKEQKTVKWGQQLRTPNIYFDILSKGRFCLLRELAVPKRGGITRINDFFHVDPQTAERFGIEDEYLLPLIKSPKDSSRIQIDMDEIELRILVCRHSKAELRKLGHRGVLKYIEWGETQTYAEGKFQGLRWPEGTWVARRQPAWYALPTSETNPARVFFAQAFGDKHMHRYCSQNIIADRRLYFLEPQDGVRDDLVSAILNSSLSALGSEVTGRVTMGDGVLDLTVEDARDYLLVPDIRNTSAEQKKIISAAFETLCKREVGNVFEEVKKKDRQALDAAVLKAIALDPIELLKPMYEALCELVRERTNLGEKRGKIRKTRARKTIAEKERLQEVLDEHLPEGPKKFPDDFFSYDAARSKRIEISLPDKPMRFEMRQLMMIVLIGREIFREVKSPAEGKYLLYCQQTGQTIALMPEKLVEVSRTVANYEGYLRNLRKTLYEAFYRRTLDVALSERLAQAVFDRFKLPKIVSD